MKQEHKYLLYLGSAFFILVLVEYFTPKPIDWTFTLLRRDKIPYGTYVLDQTIEDIFPGQKIDRNNQTLYELQQDSLEMPNLLILSDYFAPDSLDTDALLQSVAQGGHALIAANFYRGRLADTLNLDLDYKIVGKLKRNQQEEDEDTVRTDTYDQTYFTSYDSAETTVLAKNAEDKPVFIKTNFGKGALLLSSTPQIFTNYHLLKASNDQEVAQVLSFLPERNVYWTEYYQAGRMESPSPLRYMLSHPSLRWALYLCLGLLLLFMIFEAKRKQRIIPVIQPPANTTLEFVNTVSNLFLRTRDHKNMADKKIQYFLHYLRTRYGLDTSLFDQEFKEKLEHKSGKRKEEVEALLEQISHVQRQEKLSAEALLQLNRQIDSFYNQYDLINHL